jgi:TatD DNase family protein
MKLIDVHAHLESERFHEDLDAVIKRAKDAGVKIIINSGTDSERNKECLELSKKYPLIKCAFGWYPVGNSPKDIDAEIKWIEENKEYCLCIGEIGLDFKEENNQAVQQKEMFRKMLAFAKKINKPVVIHSRKAELETIEIIEDEKMKNVIMHCFSGSKSLIKRAMANGWYFSVPAVITRLQHFQTLVSIVPIEQLLTETDAPYLSPVAGERSEPKDVATTIKEIAKIKGLTEEEVAKQIWENCERLFGKV